MVTHRTPTLLLFCVLAGPLAAAGRPLTIERDQSRVDIAVHASVDSFTGQLARFEPTIAVDEGGRVTAARLEFHFLDVRTGKDGRDKAMHKWQETERFPDGLFVLASLESAAAPEAGLVAIGRLTLHGVTRDLRFPCSVLREGEAYTIDGEAAIDTRDFGLPVIRMLAVLKVDPVVRVKFRLCGRVAG
jgi:polyisoprenoid-binding protein YceI